MGVPSLNDRAGRVALELGKRAEELGCAVHTVGGAHVIDAGVEAPGSIEAGLLLARACLADLGTVGVVPAAVGDVVLPGVQVHVRFPVAACMASQYAGWQIKVGDWFAMGSGPMRAAYGGEKLFEQIGFTEKPLHVVGVLEASKLPGRDVIDYIAEKCRVKPHKVTLLAARTASLAGGVQVVARSVETAMHKLHEIGFALSRIVGGYGVAPLPPIAKDDLAAIGRTNDAVLYGAQVTLFVRGDDASIAQAGERLPSSASKDYGEPFGELFKRCGYDFYKIDPLLFSPAAVCMQNVETGKAVCFGRVNHEVLRASFFG
jgi:methenyltetrahydromethanopterin cyclohydrolase